MSCELSEDEIDEYEDMYEDFKEMDEAINNLKNDYKKYSGFYLQELKSINIYFIYIDDDNNIQFIKKEKKEIENSFSPSEFFIVKSVFHKSNFGFKEKYEILEKDFEEVSIILASKIKKKNKKLRELNDINYFSQPAAEKVNNSWYMKKKK